MSLTRLFYALALIFFAFVLEHIPLPPIIDWFQPAWVLLVVTVLVLIMPGIAGMCCGLSCRTRHWEQASQFPFVPADCWPAPTRRRNQYHPNMQRLTESEDCRAL